MRKSESAKDIDSIRDDLDSLRKDLHGLKTDIKGLLSTMKDSGQSRVNGAKDRVLEVAKDLETRLNDRLHDARDVVMEKGQEIAGKAREQVSERPVTVIMGAFLAGLLIEKLFFRRS